MAGSIEQVQFDVRGLRFDARVAGPEDGPLVVLLHGFPETSYCWRKQLPVLADGGYRVVAPDQRGYSPGARPADVDAYSSLELVDDVLAIADEVGAEQFHLVGHDWGAGVSWQLAGRHQQRLRSLTILGVPHPFAFGEALASGDGDQAQRSSYIDMFRAEGAELGMLANDAVGLRLIYIGSGMSEEDAAVYLDALGTPEALGAALNWYRAASLDHVAGLGPITVPTLFVWSTQDPALGREGAEATGKYIEGPYRFEILDGVSHWIPEEAPEAFNELLLEHLAAHP